MRNKYGNKKTEYKGVAYDSKKEAEYAHTLDLMRKSVNEADRVVKVETQPRFELQEGFVDAEGKRHRKIEYVADFKVWYADGNLEVIDVKGMQTDVYKIKKKLLLFKYKGLNFKEI